MTRPTSEIAIFVIGKLGIVESNENAFQRLSSGFAYVLCGTVDSRYFPKGLIILYRFEPLLSHVLHGCLLFDQVSKQLLIG